MLFRKIIAPRYRRYRGKIKLGLYERMRVQYKCLAKRRGYKWKLGKDEAYALFAANCYYCGHPPSHTKPDYREADGVYKYSGIDRVDSLGHYEAGNVVSCCGKCNFMKGRLSQDEFLAQCKKIGKYQRAKSRTVK